MSSSSPLDTSAWLLISSVIEMSSNGLKDRIDIDLGLLGMEDGSSLRLNGVSGREGTGEAREMALDNGVSSRSMWWSRSDGLRVVLRFKVGSVDSLLASRR